MTDRALHRAGRVALAAVTLALAVTLLSQAVPRTLAALASMPGDPVLSRIQTGQPVDNEALEALIDSRRRALDWIESGRLYTDLGLAQLMLAQARDGGGTFEEPLLTEAIGSLRKGLALAPARPHAWTRLAYAELAAGRPLEQVARALEMALITAPYEPRLLFPRLELCLLAWPGLSEQTVKRAHEQIRIAWTRDPNRLVALAHSSGRANIVRSALVQSLEALVGFNRRYRNATGT